jgi:hypothetical protein
MATQATEWPFFCRFAAQSGNPFPHAFAVLTASGNLKLAPVLLITLQSHQQP